jgi:hypothetical protein
LVADNTAKLNPFDPLDINRRLYTQVSVLLEQLEDSDKKEKIALRERIAALTAIGRLQVVFASLRKGSTDDDNRGSSVRQYTGAFANAASGRTAHSRSGPADVSDVEGDDWFERDDPA